MTRLFSLHQVGDVIIQGDTTDSFIAEAVNAQLARIKAAYELDSSATVSEKEDAVLELKDAMNQLKTLAQQGVLRDMDRDSTTADSRVFYLTKPMLDSIDDLSRIMNASGIDLGSVGIISTGDVAGFDRWLAFLDVENMIRAGQISSAINRSIQEMVETEYVVEANELIFNELEGLQERLSYTKDILADLAAIQHDKNKVQASALVPKVDAEGFLIDSTGSRIAYNYNYEIRLETDGSGTYYTIYGEDDQKTLGTDGQPIKIPDFTWPWDGGIPPNIPVNLGSSGAVFQAKTYQGGIYLVSENGELLLNKSNGLAVYIDPNTHRLKDTSTNDVVDWVGNPYDYVIPIHNAADHLPWHRQFLSDYIGVSDGAGGYIGAFPQFKIKTSTGSPTSGYLLNDSGAELLGSHPVKIDSQGFFINANTNVRIEINGKEVHIDDDPTIVSQITTTFQNRAELVKQTGTIDEITGAAEDAFAAPISIIPDPTFGGQESGGSLDIILDNINVIRDRINNVYLPFLKENRSVNPATGDVWDKPPEGSLEEKLTILVAGLPITADYAEYQYNADGSVFQAGGVATWLIDALDEEGNELAARSGDFQEQITVAIVSAENINDEQKEELKRTFFLFEEFYKSATAVMAKINQLIEKMGSNIASR